MDEVGDGLNLICGGIDEAEGVGSLVADGRHADGAEMENIVEKAGLLETDVFDPLELDDIGGFVKESVAGLLNDAMVGDVDFVVEIDFRPDSAREEEEDVDDKDDDAEDGHGTSEEGVCGAGGIDENESESTDEEEDDLSEPDEDEASSRSGDFEHDVFILLE